MHNFSHKKKNDTKEKTFQSMDWLLLVFKHPLIHIPFQTVQKTHNEEAALQIFLRLLPMKDPCPPKRISLILDHKSPLIWKKHPIEAPNKKT